MTDTPPPQTPEERARMLTMALVPAGQIETYLGSAEFHAAVHVLSTALVPLVDALAAGAAALEREHARTVWILERYPVTVEQAHDLARSPEVSELALLDTIEVVFDGPPGPECGRFIETELPDGTGVGVGEWIDRGDGTWALRFRVPSCDLRKAGS